MVSPRPVLCTIAKVLGYWSYAIDGRPEFSPTFFIKFTLYCVNSIWIFVCLTAAQETNKMFNLKHLQGYHTWVYQYQNLTMQNTV